MEKSFNEIDPDVRMPMPLVDLSHLSVKSAKRNPFESQPRMFAVPSI